MSKQASGPLTVDITCTEKCKFKNHGNLINTALTHKSISDYNLACYISSCCKNYGQVLDDKGRCALHLAASCGRRDLCYWLLKTGNVDINIIDHESGYTPLHRSIFYGHINNAVFLIQEGAHVQVMDKDDLQASDHAMKDRLTKEFSMHNPCQVYVWGTNNNYTLGTGNQHSRPSPELLDFFRKKNISINQVSIDKFHSVFVSVDGRVWTCGHGQGGRLGLDSEQTVITPQQVRTGSETVVSASVGRNHTLLLMDSGSVWSCGFNTHHVLGHVPPPNSLLAARPLSTSVLKKVGGVVVGVSAARFHSVIWSDSAVLTFGLNGGQLGHPKLQEKTIVAPRQVTGLGQSCHIVDVASSVGATVVCVKKGDIYLLNNYQLRRINALKAQQKKIIDVVKVEVFGGELSADVDDKLITKGGEEIKIMVLTSTGKLLLWQESFPLLTRCIHTLKRSLTFTRLSMSSSCVMLVTDDGEVYQARVKPKAKKRVPVSNSKPESVSFNQFIEKLDCHHLSISRVPHVHRAVSVAVDPKGQNFMVIQEHPKVNLIDIPLIDGSEFSLQMAALLKDAHEDDSLHDILIQLDKGSVPAHQFVLAQSSELFADMPRSTGGRVTTVVLKGVTLQALLQVLTFIYTQDCNIINPGPYQPYDSKTDPIKAAFDLAKMWKVAKLIRYLQLLRYEDGMIRFKDADANVCKVLRSRTKLQRSMLPALHDVSIASSDNATFKAHKCVLAARLEYFNSMFTGGWVEADATTNLTLPIPQIILRELIDFLYEDESTSLSESQDVDYISSVLVVADQLFIHRLKQICESALSANVSLRNVAYLLQLAITYNADQLKSCCMQFVCINLAAVLENRSLEILDNKTLEELSIYYRNAVPAMCKRIITPFTAQLTEDEILEAASNNPVSWIDSESKKKIDSPSQKFTRPNPTPISGKKRSQRSHRTSESQKKRLESVSSNSDLESSAEVTSMEKIDFDDLIEITPEKVTMVTEEWVTVDKTQKAVQNRLKVVLQAATIQPTPETFTRLPLKSNSSSQNIESPPSTKDNREFPELTTQTKFSSPPKISFIDIKRKPVLKLSQKQRKKLAYGEEEANLEVKDNKPAAPLSAWAPVPAVPAVDINCSLSDIMNNKLTVGSPPHAPSERGQGQLMFVDIIAEEIEQRDNWSKMKSKSLQLTQIEDKAMEELRSFYNAVNIVDERITVERVLSANVAKPMWITSRHC